MIASREYNLKIHGRYETVGYHVWFPPVPAEHVARIRQIAYLTSEECRVDDVTDVITERWGYGVPLRDLSIIHQEMEGFIASYSGHVYDLLRTYIQDNIKIAFALGEHVHFDPVEPKVFAASIKKSSTTLCEWTRDVDDLQIVMAHYFAARNRLLRDDDPHDEYALMQPKNAAGLWIIREFNPSFEAYMQEMVDFGTTDGQANARYVLSHAADFAYEIGIEHGVTVLSDTGFTEFGPGQFFLEPWVGNILARASEQDGTINSIPFQELNIPWDILPRRSFLYPQETENAS